MFSELRNTLVHLYDEDALGTDAVLTWAKHVKDVGYTKQILKVLDGDWAKSHQLRDDENWSTMMDKALEHVRGYVGEKRISGSKAEEL